MNPQSTFTPHGAPIREKRLLPVQPPTQMIGRKRDLSAVHTTLKTGSAVVLTGPSGIGKTVSAAVIATAQIASNPGGVVWLRLDEDDLPSLVTRIGRSYATDTYPTALTDLTRHMATVRQLLQTNKPLLVLDGIVDLPTIHSFIRECATGLPVLILSERFEAGSWIPVNLQPLSATEAQQTYRFYAGLPEGAEASDVEALSTFIGEIPLPLELAGRLASTESFSTAQLLEQLTSISGNNSLQVMLGLSFKLLDAASQGVLMLLAAMSSAAASIELLSSVAKMPITDVLNIGRKLVARGLARESLSYGQPHFRLHGLVQQFVRNWLSSYQRLSAAEGRAMTGVLAYAEHQANGHQPEPRAAYDKLAGEMENIMGAAAVAAARDRADVVDRFITVLEDKADDFVLERHFLLELEQLKQLARIKQPQAKLDANPPEAKVAIKPLAPPTPPVKVDETVLPINLQGLELPPLPESGPDLVFQPAALALDEPLSPSIAQPMDTIPLAPPQLTLRKVTVAPLASKPLTILSDEPEPDADATRPELPAIALPPTGKLGSSILETPPPLEQWPVPLSNVGRATEEIAAIDVPMDAVLTELPSLVGLQAELAAATQQQNKPRMALILSSLAGMKLDLGTMDEAQADYQQARTLFAEAGDQQGELGVIEQLMGLAQGRGDTSTALALTAQALDLATASKDPARLGRLLIKQGDFNAALNNYDAAANSYQRSVETLRSTNDWTQMGLATSKLGGVLLISGKPQEAAPMLEAAIAMFRRERRGDYELRSLMRMGTALLALQQWPQAQQLHEQALILAKDQLDWNAEAENFAAIGYLRELLTDRDGAILYYRRALHAAYQLGDTRLKASHMFQLAEYLIDDTRTLNQAIALLNEASELVPSSEVKRLLKRAEHRLDRVMAAQVAISESEGSNQDYAASAYVA